MVSRRVISGVVLLGVLAAAPVFAQDGQRRRSGGDRRNDQSESPRTGRAVPRSQGAVRSDNAPREQAQQAQVQRQYQAQAPSQQSRGDQRVQAQRQYQGQQRQYRDDQNYDSRRDYAVRREYQRPYYPSVLESVLCSVRQQGLRLPVTARGPSSCRATSPRAS